MVELQRLICQFTSWRYKENVMTDDEKLEISRAKFKARLDLIVTWDEFKTLLNNLTKTRIKNFIRNALQDEATKRRDIFAQAELSKASDIEALKQEVNTI